MGKKIRETLLWIFALLFIGGIADKLIQYAITMYYSGIAPSQLDDDSAYSIMQTEAPVQNVYIFIKIVVVILVIWRIIKIWTK